MLNLRRIIKLYYKFGKAHMSERKNVWLDCDPGHDDMLAIILAALSQQINCLGISTSAGNSTIENTTKNALNILYEIQRNDIEVYKGAIGPLIEELKTCPVIHGQSGLQGAVLKVSNKKPITQNTTLNIYNNIKKSKTKVYFVVTGAMTNLAILLKAFPDVLDRIQKIVIMGGAIGLGNWSPAGEFNIMTDPQAAHIVFNCGIQVVMMPLQVTHTVLIDEQIFKSLQEMGTQFSNKLFHLFKFFQKQYKYHQNFDYPVAHDPCTIYYLLHPQNCIGRQSHVEIQLLGNSRGRTNCTFMHLKKPANSFVCERINVKHFWEVMLKAIKKIK